MVASAVSSHLQLRPVETVEEYRACQEVQRRAWGIAEDGYVVPVATMISVQHAGGLVLGAFDRERLVGFSFGFLGRVRGRWVLYSQLTGVDPAVQDKGAGGQLKAAQRQWAREQGLPLVVWSYDPLQAGNANFNLRRLGAVSRTYEVNYFGERTDTLNLGLETDRLLVEWSTEDELRAWQGDGLPPVEVISFEQATDGPRCPRGAGHDVAVWEGSGPAAPLQLEIPADIANLKAQNAELSRVWQLAVRDAFQRSFATGYVAMDFVREPAGPASRAYYVLKRPQDEVE